MAQKSPTNTDKLDQFRSSPLFTGLSTQDRSAMEKLAAEERLSVQQLRRILEAARDLQMWGASSLAELTAQLPSDEKKSKQRGAKITEMLISSWEEARQQGPDYSAPAKNRMGTNQHIEESPAPRTILGDCPVASPKTRCCNLQTLDAAINCGFGCSYCTIQSFYDEGRIFLHSDLKEHLTQLQLDPEKTYHIGTGQSSDSLMWGNKGDLLKHLFDFARHNPNVILELKTKSANTGYLLENRPPANVLATWTLNSRQVIEHEEHGTASLDERINAARRCADAGILVGFHFHPMIRHQGWQEAYSKVFQLLLEKFSPEEVALTSIGTLTYIKPVIRAIRERGEHTQVLRLPLEETAGKYSYPFTIKKELFSFAYQSLKPWHEKVFFYMCMEDPELWQPVFGRGYSDNESFEEAMKTAYMEKIRSHTR